MRPYIEGICDNGGSVEVIFLRGGSDISHFQEFMMGGVEYFFVLGKFSPENLAGRGIFCNFVG